MSRVSARAPIPRRGALGLDGVFTGSSTCQEGRQHDHGPLSRAVGFHKDQMVRRTGLEPVPPD